MKKITLLISLLLMSLMGLSALAPTPTNNHSPVILDMTTTPSDGITSSTTVVVSATVTDADVNLSGVSCNWGTDLYNLNSQITMSALEDAFTTDAVIPAQTNGTTVYYSIVAIDATALFTISDTLSYMVGPSAADSIFISQNCDPLKDYSKNRFTEIYNPTTSEVDLTGWSVVSVQNGVAKFSWLLSGTIASGEALVMGFDSHTSAVSPDFSTTSSNASWNGAVDDGAILKNASGDTLDYVVGALFSDKQMVRLSTVIVPSTTYTASEWTISSVDSAQYATPGTHECVLPIVAAGSEAPTITNFLPADATTFTLGESFNVSAIVTTTDGSIDSVRFAYGTESSNLGDTSKMMQDVLNQDSFYLPMSIGDEGTYYGQVIAYGSNSTTKSSSITSVIAECGVVEAPVASAASEILATSFTANWGASTGALGYLLDVWTEESTSEVVYVSSDFDDGVSPLPTGWSDNDKVYTTSAGFNGDGLKLGTADISGVLTSPLFSVSESFSVIFYAKQYDMSEKTITVSYGLQNQEITTLTEEWQEQIVDFTAESGEKSVSFSAGRAYLDSVIIKSGGITKNNVLLGDSVKFGTSKVVTGLPESTTYKYAVSAYNAYGCESDMSNVISVITGTATALNNVVSPLQVFTNEGQIIVRSTEELMLQVYDITGRQVAHQLLNDQVTIPVKSGLYIVKANETITKVAVK